MQDQLRATGSMRNPMDMTKEQYDALLEEAREGSSGTPKGGGANSQLMGSDVLVYSKGNAVMDFRLHFPPSNDPYTDPREYRVHPLLTFPLGDGTLFVFSSLDDLLFYHDAKFSVARCHNLSLADMFHNLWYLVHSRIVP